MNDENTPDSAQPIVAEEPTFVLFQFGNWKVNTFVPPVLLGLVWFLNSSSLGGMMIGFHIWMHEFGHATAAWLCGYKATPLPIGWTPVEPVYSSFVYFGLLLLFGILFWSGWREWKPWPMVAAVALAGLQFYMTWCMPAERQEFWWSAFGGVGGEFYLSALSMAFFYVQMPEGFKWGMCRYIFFIIGASAFLHIIVYWNEVYHGREDIPLGSMINGEDDSNGDMNKLMDQFDWTAGMIRDNYQHLGYACWVGLGIVYTAFALRLNLMADWVAKKFGPGEEVATEGEKSEGE